MKELVERLTQKQLTISSIESFTVGKFGSAIGSIPGASKVYAGSVVSYFTRIKADIVGVEWELINTYGVVSHEVCKAMCEHGRKLMNTDLCISFTGNAGPDTMENKPAGLVYVGINYRGEIQTYELRLTGNRQEVVEQAILFAKTKIFEKL